MPETPDDQPGRPPGPKHDAGYKSLFARRRTVEDTLRALPLATVIGDADQRDPELDDLVRRLDFSTLERMPADFVTEHLGRRHADMLWRIRTVDETWLHLLVLFEFQSTVDRRMALRTMNYAGGIWTGLDSAHPGPEGSSRSCSPWSSTAAGGAGARRGTSAISWPPRPPSSLDRARGIGIFSSTCSGSIRRCWRRTTCSR